jgi:hypothetical protein
VHGKNLAFVQIGLPCGDRDSTLKHVLEVRKMKLLKSPTGEAILEDETLRISESRVWHMWTTPEGAEATSLAFGRKLQVYQSADYPPAPIL